MSAKKIPALRCPVGGGGGGGKKIGDFYTTVFYEI